MSSVPASLGSQPRGPSNRGRYRKRSHDDDKYHIGESWSVGRVEDEAKCLYQYMRRNNTTVEEMVALICVSDREFAELTAWVNARPAIAGKLDEILSFRQRVLVYFKAMLES